MRPVARLTRTLLAGALAVACTLASAQVVVKRDVVNEGSIGTWWRFADGVVLSAPAYPKAQSDRGLDVCVNIGYMINRDGKVSDLMLLKSWTSGGALPEAELEPFVQAAGAAVTQWRFARKVDGPVPRPLYTSATMMFFGGKTGADAASVRTQCAITNLGDFIEKKRLEGETAQDKLEHFRWQRRLNGG
ncbi:hypothetical protein [Arenimonas oryziterrae]|uniref:TonB C-terminal domain-containing protein n=1 Tax=Arenimonas oryziterrae DSM 21050 = YC6267 TaxID=1121015 RepID=A0A091BGS9_9GAMM|nr:hypothetical protein [Arenimonas oryziterrae]KFN43575.1 hypothetical protein N789_09885 [Arenimonas oryziterrae DSM 21050 = YC6267]